MFWRKKKPESLPDRKVEAPVHKETISHSRSCYDPEVVKKILVLDLDETLVHRSQFPPHTAVELLGTPSNGTYIFKRPHVDEFLAKVTTMFQVYIYTHAEQSYAKPVIDILCPMIPDDHRFYRDACNSKEGKCRKNLKIFSKTMDNIILVDDSSNARRFYPHNNIQITRWNGTPVDNSLMGEVMPILEMCAIADDVRTVIDNLPKKRSRRAYSELGA